MKRVAILQSNYIPWKGYFDLIAAVDEFILYDDMQFTRRDWRNRNQIKTPQGVQWLTVPVKIKGRFHQKIRETEIDSAGWAEAHWKALSQNYARARCYHEVAPLLESLYLSASDEKLSDLNRRFLTAICSFLGVRTVISNSWDYHLIEGKTDRLVDLCLQAKATEYISGPAAKGYLDESLFESAGIRMRWFDYDGYPEYPQLWGDFVHGVSIVDLLFNCGQDARRYMRFIER
jgi:hypothetical protein